MLHTVVLDFETASTCDLKKAGAWRYAEDPTTEVICAGFSLDEGEVQVWLPGQSQDALAALAADESVTFVAHNAAFEKAIWRRIMVPVYGFPDIPNTRWHDSMAVCAMKTVPLDLDSAAIALRLSYHKDKEGSAITRALSKPKKDGSYDRSPETIDRVVRYNIQDVRTQTELHRRVGWLPRGERGVWLLDQRINERGVRLDLDYVDACQRIVDRASVPLLGEFQTLTGGLKPTQRDKFLAWIASNGASVPDLKKETLAALLGSDDEDEDLSSDEEAEDVPELPPNVHRALAIRQLIGSASIKKLAAMMACVCEDGRARGLLQYHGAGTGRWAGRLLQPQNFPRGTLKGGPDVIVPAIMTSDPDYVSMVVGPPVEAVVSGLRHAIIANPGRTLLVGDFAGIEARVVLALAGQHDKTALMASGADVYCDMASQIYGRPIDKKKDPTERQTGKNAVLGLGFQMGWRKFKLRYAQDQDDEFAKRVVDTYRDEWAPKVPDVWYGLEKAAVRAVHDRLPTEAYGVLYELEDGWLTARLPSGRKLWYRNPQPIRKAMPWDETDVRRAWTYQARKMGHTVTIDAFGGLLTENVVQGLARDLMVAAMFKCEKAGLPISLTVHDEIVAEPLTQDADIKTLEQIMCDSPDWARHMQIPVSVEAWKGDRYRK